MLRLFFILINAMLICSRKIAFIEMIKSDDKSYMVNVIQISESTMFAGEKHHYSIDPKVKVKATTEDTSKLNDTIIAKYSFNSLVVSSKLWYNKDGQKVKFFLSCDDSCPEEEVCTVFGCQVKLPINKADL